MYKMLLPLLVLALSNWAFAADEALYKKTFKMKGEGSTETRVIETFREALNSSKPNKVKELVIRLMDDLEDTGTVSKLTKRDLFLIEGGKSSASEYYSQYIVGIPVSMKGTGLIETHSLFFNVNYVVNMATGKETVFIEEQVELTPVR